ncbi:MAG: LOG family protein [Gammaproteobacteria bacterium]|nr:MAG: LOG family protein [Gammaproteobacteria bacterium]
MTQTPETYSEPLPPGDERVSVDVSPRGSLEMLSQLEVGSLRRLGHGSAHELFRRCALAVLNSGTTQDDAAAIFDRYHDFEVEVLQRTRGVKLRIRNAPAGAFVDGRMIEGIKEHLFAVLRDVVYIATEISDGTVFDLDNSAGITNAVFHVLRNAGVLTLTGNANLVVCWGGHSISRGEYDYSKQVGYVLGLRGLDICTGCGPGAMKGPMKGAAVGHAKQRNRRGRYVGVSEPGIIAAEPPNPMVNRLAILPDIEKRLEGFVRLAHAVVIFPGGVGTVEEILYLLGLLLHPENADQQLPVILTGPAGSEDWFEAVDELLVTALGEEVRGLYEIHVDDPWAVSKAVARGVKKVRKARVRDGDAFYFNWLLHVPYAYQQPFHPTHEHMAALRLTADAPRHELVADLRRAFSGIVAGNVKEQGIRHVRQHGPWELHADPALLAPLDRLLESFVSKGRMKLNGRDYVPCYRLIR